MNKATLLAVAAAGLLSAGAFAVAETTATKPAAAPTAAAASAKEATPGKRKAMRNMTLEEARVASKERMDKMQKRHDELMKMTPQQWEEKKKEMAARHAKRGKKAPPAAKP